MKRLIKKVLKDLLQNDEGKFSRKSMLWAGGSVVYFASIFIGLFTDKWMPNETLYTLTTMVLGVTGLTVVDKIKENGKGKRL